MIRRSKTFVAFPPGVTIMEVFENNEISMSVLMEKIGTDSAGIQALLDGEAPLTPEISDALEQITGVSAAFWNNLERAYREKLIKVYYENKADSGAVSGRLVHA